MKPERVPTVKRQETARLRALIPAVMAAHPQHVWWTEEQLLRAVGTGRAQGGGYWLRETMKELARTGRVRKQGDPLSHQLCYALPEQDGP